MACRQCEPAAQGRSIPWRIFWSDQIRGTTRGVTADRTGLGASCRDRRRGRGVQHRLPPGPARLPRRRGRRAARPGRRHHLALGRVRRPAPVHHQPDPHDHVLVVALPRTARADRAGSGLARRRRVAAGHHRGTGGRTGAPGQRGHHLRVEHEPVVPGRNPLDAADAAGRRRTRGRLPARRRVRPAGVAHPCSCRRGAGTGGTVRDPHGGHGDRDPGRGGHRDRHRPGPDRHRSGGGRGRSRRCPHWTVGRRCGTGRADAAPVRGHVRPRRRPGGREMPDRAGPRPHRLLPGRERRPAGRRLHPYARGLLAGRRRTSTGHPPQPVRARPGEVRRGLGRRPATGYRSCERTPIDRVVHGPEAFTPDGEFILGETAVRGFWVAAGFCVHGLAAAGGVGKVMAEWIVDGAPEYDVSTMDIRRFGAHAASRSWATTRALDAYARYYDIVYPDQECGAGPATAPLGDLAATGRVGRRSSARSPAGNGSTGSGSTRPPATRPGAPTAGPGGSGHRRSRPRCRATTDAAGLFDQSSFAKLDVRGAGRPALCCNACAPTTSTDPPGTVVYTQLLNERGRDRGRPHRDPARRGATSGSSPARPAGSGTRPGCAGTPGPTCWSTT